MFCFGTTVAETISSFSVPVSEGNKQEYTVGTVTGCAVDGETSNPAGTVCVVPITFSPGYPGLRRVPLHVLTSAGQVSIGLTGMGVGPLAVFTPGSVSTLAGGGGQGSCQAYSGPALLGALCNPSAGAVDYAGNVYVAAFYSNTVSKIDTSGNTTVIAGTGAGGLSGVGGPAASATFDRPSDVVVDAAGNVYFAAEFAEQVFRIDAVTQILTSIAGNGNTGYSGDGGPATMASLNRPEGLALDTQGNLYIEDQDNNLIRKVDTAGIITTVAGNPATIGQGLPAYGGDGGPATQAGLALCCSGVYASYDSITVDPAGNLFIGDSGHSVVRKVTTDGIIHTVAGNNALGQGSAGNGGLATSAQLNFPMGVAVDPAGDLYIADFSNNRIQKVDAATQIVSTVVGNGTQGSASNGLSTQISLNGPQKVALDGRGNLYVADTKNNLVRKSDVSNPLLTFATPTLAGTPDTTDGALGVAVANIGNAPLNLAPAPTGVNPTVSAGFSLYTAESGACATSMMSATAGTIGQGNRCNLQVTFAPISGGAVAGSLVLMDNSLNMTNPFATQTVSLAGLGTAPAPVLTPSSLDFGSLTTGTTSAAQTATLTNSGSATLTISSFGITGGNASSFKQSNNCDSLLLAGSSCSFSITCAPAAVGALTATFAVNYPSPQPQQTVALSCTAVAPAAPQAVLSPASVSFGSVTTATTSAAQTFTLSNPGSAALPVTSIALGGSNAGSFALAANTCGLSLGAGSSCSISVTFSPASVGAASATLNVVDSVGTQSSALSGSGVAPAAPQAALTPANASFGSVTVGTASAPLSFTLTNGGNAALPVSSVVVTGAGFALTGNTCSTSLAAGASCAITVVFTPAAVASSAATLTVVDSVGTQSSALSGSGVAPAAPQAALTPANASFGSVTVGTASAPLSFSLTNGGNAALPVSSVVVSGAGFALTGNTCSTSLAAGASCAITVVFTPMSVASSAATLTVVDSVGTQTSALTGTGLAPAAPQAALTPATASFGSIAVGAGGAPLSFSLTNGGNAALPVSSVAVTGVGFALTGNTCSTSLAAGASCTLTVAFAPTTAGTSTATLTVVDAVGTQSSALTGTGFVSNPPDFSITPQPAAQSSYRGQSVSYVIALASLSGANPFTAPVTLSATGLPKGATATFSPATVVPGATTTLTIAVPALSAANRHFKGTGVAFAALLFGLMLTRRRRFAPRLLLALLALVAASAASGCGSGNGFAIPVTTSTITVTGTSGTNVHSTIVTLTVN